MLSVLDLDPVRGAAGAIWPITMFGDQSLQSHHADMTEQAGTYLALLEISQEDTVDAPGQEPGKVIFAEMQWQLAEILAVADQDVT